MHGGVKEGDARVKHYRYSSIRRERIAELIAEHQRDPDPLNILPEIAALRALFQEFVERYDENTEALLAWHASFALTKNPLPEEMVMSFEALVAEWEIKLKESGDDATPKQQGDLEQSQKFLKLLREGTEATKPRTVLDLTDAYRVLGEIGRMVERVEKIRNINGITRMDLNRVIGEMGRVVDTLVMDDTSRRRSAMAGSASASELTLLGSLMAPATHRGSIVRDAIERGSRQLVQRALMGENLIDPVGSADGSRRSPTCSGCTILARGRRSAGHAAREAARGAHQHGAPPLALLGQPGREDDVRRGRSRAALPGPASRAEVAAARPLLGLGAHVGAVREHTPARDPHVDSARSHHRSARAVPEGHARDIIIRADNGKLSRITGKAAEQGAERYQSARIHRVWLDEEHPESVWDEMQPRLLRHGGDTLATMTPLKGYTWVHGRVYEPAQTGKVSIDRHWFSHAGLKDNPSITPEGSR
jgi:phage terminase large subunit-like protein